MKIMGMNSRFINIMQNGYCGSGCSTVLVSAALLFWFRLLCCCGFGCTICCGFGCCGCGFGCSAVVVSAALLLWFRSTTLFDVVSAALLLWFRMLYCCGNTVDLTDFQFLTYYFFVLFVCGLSRPHILPTYV